MKPESGKPNTEFHDLGLDQFVQSVKLVPFPKPIAVAFDRGLADD